MQTKRAHSLKKEAPDIRKALAAMVSLKNEMERLVEVMQNEDPPKHRDFGQIITNLSNKIPSDVFLKFIRAKEEQDKKIFLLETEVEKLRARKKKKKSNG